MLLHSDFVSSCLHDNFDIWFITETHLCIGQQFEIKIFHEYPNSFSVYDCKNPRGGISCFIAPEILQYILNIILLYIII